jgi:ERCC4-related helicase
MTTATPITPTRLRPYQERIVNTAKQFNTIVLLPTGSGKTWIAADALIHVGTPAVFFVPTVPLAAQQAAALRDRPNMPRVEEYHGDIKTVPRDFDVLVTTPKAFEVAQQTLSDGGGGGAVATLSWGRFKVVVFDEVHHVLKDHPYRSLALKLLHSGYHPRVIGLTASLTYAVGTEKISKSVKKLCQELSITRIEHATDAELRSGGYLGARRAAVAEVRLTPGPVRDDLVSESVRQPHPMHEMFFNRLDNSTATLLGQELVETIKSMEAAMMLVDGAFRSPLDKVSLRSWGEYAHERILYNHLYGQLEHWYEALRLLIISWEEGDDAAVMFLCMMKCNQERSMMLWPASTKTKIQQFFDMHPTSSSERFNNMCTVLLEKMNDLPSFRGIIFAQQRIMTHIIKYVIENKSPQELSSRIRARCLYATKSPATASLSVSKFESRKALEAFSIGQANLLISTSVAEEGLDVPAANCVIYFDPIHHAVSYVQGRGRARQENSSFVMLNQRRDRPATLLAQQECELHSIASSFVPLSPVHFIDPAIALKTLKDREKAAACFLCDVSKSTALGNLDVYTKKTKAVVDEVHEVDAENWTICRLTYRTFKRTVSVEGRGAGKKAAKKNASMSLLEALHACTIQDPL